MASKTAENVFCLQVFGSLAGQETMNDFYYRLDHPASHAELAAILTDVTPVIAVDWSVNLPSTWHGRSLFAFDMTTPTGENAVDDGISSAVGSAGGTPLPNNVTIAIARKNGLRGRSGNGRIFWQGLTSGQLADENRVSSGTQAALLENMAQLDNIVITHDAVPVILSFQHDGVVTTEATVFTLANWVFSDDVIDSRRRRLPGRGV